MPNQLPPQEKIHIQSKWLAAQTNTPKALNLIKRIQTKFRWLKNQKISFKAYLATKKLSADRHRIFGQVYGFSLQETSRKNIQALRKYLGKLSTAEEIIYRELTQSLTGIHLTKYGHFIKKAGQIESIRLLESKQDIVGTQIERRTGVNNKNDGTVHFLAELPHGGTVPGDLDHCPDEIVIQLASLLRDPLVCSRTYVTGHAGDFSDGYSLSTQIAETTMKTEHFVDENTRPERKMKTYTFLYPDGTYYRWRRLFEDELFAGFETLSGITYLFLTLLRHLGGEKNSFVKQLYTAAENNVDRHPLREALRIAFPIIFPVPTYPEIKIFDFLDITAPYVTISTRQKKPVQHSSSLNDFMDSLFNVLVPFSLSPNNQTPDFSLVKLFLEGKLLPGEYYRHCFLNNVFNEEIPLEIQKNIAELILFNHSHLINRIECQKITNVIFHKLSQYIDEAFLLKILSTRFPAQVQEPKLSQWISYQPSPTRDFINALFDNPTLNVCLLKRLDAAGVDFELNGSAYYEKAILSENIPVLTFLDAKKVSYHSFKFPGATPLIFACLAQRKKSALFLMDKYNINDPFNYKSRDLQLNITGTLLNFYEDIPSDPKTGSLSADYETIIYVVGIKSLIKSLEDLFSGNGSPVYDKKRKNFLPFLNKHGANIKLPKLPHPTPTFAPTPLKTNNVAIFVVFPDHKNRLCTVLGVPRQHVVIDEDKLHRPFFCFPGGNVDCNESLSQAAVRELKEETSIDIHEIPNTTISLIGTFPIDDRTETSFFLVNIGTPLSTLRIYPLDDLVRSIKLPIAEIDGCSFQYEGGTHMILPSNALLMTAFKENFSPSFALSESEKTAIGEQLQIESRGVSMLREKLKASTTPPIIKRNEIEVLLEKKAAFFGEECDLRLFIKDFIAAHDISLITSPKNRLPKNNIFFELPMECFFKQGNAFLWFLDNRYTQFYAQDGFYRWVRFYPFNRHILPKETVEALTQLYLTHQKTRLKENGFLSGLYNALLKDKSDVYSNAFRKTLLTFRNNLTQFKDNHSLDAVPTWIKNEVLFFEKYLNINTFLSDAMNEEKPFSASSVDSLYALFQENLTKATLTQLITENSIFLSPLPASLITFQKKWLNNEFQAIPFVIDTLSTIPFALLETHKNYWARIIRESFFQKIILPISVTTNENLRDWRSFLMPILQDMLSLQDLTLIQTGAFDDTFATDILALIGKIPLLEELDCQNVELKFLKAIFSAINQEGRRHIKLNVDGDYTEDDYKAMLAEMEAINFFNHYTSFPKAPFLGIEIDQCEISEKNKKQFFASHQLTLIPATQNRYVKTLILPLPYSSGSFETERFYLKSLEKASPQTLIIDCAAKNSVSQEYISLLRHNLSIELLILRNAFPDTLGDRIKCLVERIAKSKMPALKFIGIESDASEQKIVLSAPLLLLISAFMENRAIQFISFSSCSVSFDTDLRLAFENFCKTLAASKTLWGVALGWRFFKNHPDFEKLFVEILSSSTSLRLCDLDSPPFAALQNKIMENRKNGTPGHTDTLKRSGLFSKSLVTGIKKIKVGSESDPNSKEAENTQSMEQK